MLPGDGEFFEGVKESRGDNGKEVYSRRAGSFFFAVALNEILFGGETQLGNIRTRILV